MGLTFDDGKGFEFHDRSDKSGACHDVNDIRHVLIRFWDFFRNGSLGQSAHPDSFGLKSFENLFLFRHLESCLAGKNPSSPMAGGPPSIVQGLLGSYHHITISPHITGDEHGVTDVLVRFGNVWMARGEGPGGSFSMHTQPPWFAIDVVSFPFCDVVAAVIHKVQPQGRFWFGEETNERLSNEVREHLTIGEGVIDRAGHSVEVGDGFWAMQGSGAQLAVG